MSFPHIQQNLFEPVFDGSVSGVRISASMEEMIQFAQESRGLGLDELVGRDVQIHEIHRITIYLLSRRANLRH